MDNVFIKQNVSQHEYNTHKYVYDLNIVNIPAIISYCPDTKVMEMKRIDGMSVSDWYGENIDNVPNPVYENIVEIVRLLMMHGICYPDFTGYNFMISQEECNNSLNPGDSLKNIWIIDFEHASINKHMGNVCMNGLKKWNPDFA